MGYRLDFSSPLLSDPQDELPLAYCPLCLGEVYPGEAYREDGAALYHVECWLEGSKEQGGTRDDD